jgi:hypothetical protein
MISVTRSRSEKAELGFFLGWFFFLLLVGHVKLLQDPDTFWHIAAGHQVLDTGRVITPILSHLPFTENRGSPTNGCRNVC